MNLVLLLLALIIILINIHTVVTLKKASKQMKERLDDQHKNETSNKRNFKV